ncbi:MAG: hypothetical protein ACM3SQ_01430 [Betaproteobacteria bacterium]
MNGLRILVFEELPGTWIARALEHDAIAEARTMDLAVARLLGFLGAHIEFDRRHRREPLSAFAVAPQLYWTAFARATLACAELLPLATTMPWPGCITVAVATERPGLGAPPLHPLRPPSLRLGRRSQLTESYA